VSSEDPVGEAPELRDARVAAPDDRPGEPAGAFSEPTDGSSASADAEGVDPAAERPTAGSHRRRAAKARPQRPFWIEFVVLIGIALAIALVVHTFFFQAFFIPSGSMENTLHVGDRVLVNRMSYKVGHVQRGQIIVFNGVDSWTPESTVAPPSNIASRFAHDVGSFLGFAPAGEKDFIKRVIGVPGDHVQCCDAQGRIMVNGKALDETYLASGIPNAVPATTQVNAARPFDIVVPPGRVWVEGDHRDDSADSRSHVGDPGGGTIPESKIIGHAFVIVWPIGHMGTLGIPKAFHGVPAAALGALPASSGVIAVAPIALWRWRRRRRRQQRTTAATSA
jgi:signal peptidase I